MKTNDKQKKVLVYIKTLLSYWETSNDINSPTLEGDIKEELVNLGFDLSDTEEENLIENVTNLLNNVKNFSDIKTFNSKLTLDIIEKYNIKKCMTPGDWDDKGYTYTFPNGLSLGGFFMYNNIPCKHMPLEGLDGYVYLETEQELIDFINNTDTERILKDIKKSNPEFDIDDYL